MRRFYSAVEAQPTDGGFGIFLDGRQVMTPEKRPLVLGNTKLAQAIAAEWAAQGEKIDPLSMPLTGFANAAIDKVAPSRAGFIATIAAYGESDLLCYRAETPAPLIARQAETWDPLLDWAVHRYNCTFKTTAGIIHIAQTPATLERLKDAVAAFDSPALAAMAKLVSLSGSLILTLALAERHKDADTLWAASCLDELWQAELWGEDDFALKNRRDRHTDFSDAARFLELSQIN